MTSILQEIHLLNSPNDQNVTSTPEEGLVIFCRHGQLDLFGGKADLSKYRGVYASGDSDIQLSDEGFEQARKFGFYLYYRAQKFNKIPIFAYSPAVRCWQTYKASSLMSGNYNNPIELEIDELKEHVLDFIITGQTGARLKSSTDFLLGMDSLIAAIPNYYEYESNGMRLIHESTSAFKRRSQLALCRTVFRAIKEIKKTKEIEKIEDLHTHDLVVHTHGRMIGEWCGSLLKNWGYNYIPRCLPLAVSWSYAITLAKIYARQFRGVESLFGLDDQGIGFDEPEIETDESISEVLKRLKIETVLKSKFPQIDLPFWLDN